MNKYPPIYTPKAFADNDKFEFVEGIRSSGKFEAEKTQLMLNLLKMAALEEEMFIKVSKPIDPKYLKREKTLTELIDEGYTFKEANKIMKERNKQWHT